MTDRSWSLLTKARNGLISVIRDLTLDECREMWVRLDQWYEVEHYAESETNSCLMPKGSGYSEHPGDIIQREVFGPPDWDHKAAVEEWQTDPRLDVDILWDDLRHWRFK